MNVKVLGVAPICSQWCLGKYDFVFNSLKITDEWENTAKARIKEIEGK